MKLNKTLLLPFLVLTINCLAQSVTQNLEKSFNNLLNDEQAKYAITSLCVLDGQTGKIIFAKNENVGLATASTLKTITAATAFSILGKDFSYTTTLAYSGKIIAGVLQGDLIIIGSGDPTLGSWRYENTKETDILNQWVNAIKAAGITKIEGKIIGEDGLFDTQTIPLGWIWQDIGNFYGAGATALNWRENQFDLNLNSGKNTGDEVTILKTIPAQMPEIKIVNELKTGSQGSGDNAYAFLPPYSNLAYLRGTWGIGITKKGIAVATPDPALATAFSLTDTLKRIGFIVTQKPTTTRILNLEAKPIPRITQNLVTTQSPTLTEINYWFLKKSVNLYGEALLKTLAQKTTKTATTANGALTVTNYWASKGIDPNSMNIIDGSGLSPGNRVTTAAMANVLFLAQKEPWFAAYFNGFPIYNGMNLKSGSINDVSAYAGYYTNKAGNKYIVVININNYNGNGISKKLFKVLDLLK